MSVVHRSPHASGVDILLRVNAEESRALESLVVVAVGVFFATIRLNEHLVEAFDE